MARGWESKSVESQIESSEQRQPVRRPQQSPADLARARQRDDLQLTRTRLLTQIAGSNNNRYTDMLRKALAEIEGKLSRA